MTNEYKDFILSEIHKANEEWKKALAEGRNDDAYISGKRAADLEAIYYYHTR